MNRMEPDPPPPSFVDGEDATRHLAEPEEPEEFHDPMTTFEEAVDWVDPGAWVMKIAVQLCGINPLEEVFSRLAGDWRNYARCAEVFENLGRFFESVGWNLKSGNDGLDGYWSGNAADASWVYFDQVSRKVVAHKEPLEELANQYRTAAHGAYSFSRMAGPVAAMAIDKLIVAAVSIAAGTATAETGVGAAIGYGIAAVEAIEIMEDVEHIMKLIGECDVLVRGAEGAIRTASGRFVTNGLDEMRRVSLADGLSVPALPGSS